MHHLAYKILSYLDAKSLCRAEQVCNEWYHVVADGLLWKKLIERKVATDPVWKGLSERRGWGSYLFRHVDPSEGITHMYYRQLYPNIIKDIEVGWTHVTLRSAFSFFPPRSPTDHAIQLEEWASQTDPH